MEAKSNSNDLQKSQEGFNKRDKKMNDTMRSENKSNQSGAIGVPTLKMLNPELFKEMQKAELQMKDPVFLSVRNLKERHSYQEMRVQRIHKRTEEMTKELEIKQEELIKRNKLL